MCRRCGECRNSEHHWTDNLHFGDDPSQVEAIDEAHRKQLVQCEWKCKHCDALAMTCLTCDGNGDLEHEDDEYDSYESDDDQLSDSLACPACGGNEVVLVRPETVR